MKQALDSGCLRRGSLAERSFIGIFPAEVGVPLSISLVRTIRLLTLAFLLAAALPAGPVDFGLNEYKSALAARNLKWKIAYEVTSDPPESYRIEPYKYGGAHVTGGDLRGLMYGLLEAAEQIRTTGRLKQVHANPTTMSRRAIFNISAGSRKPPPISESISR